ncbi:response regulator transcription factor [Ruminococcaceae bacterium OttesenSCG-928-I18]|nr:response regulator transcription factor [Ruminococcaceae bacterium OttesenSCG-928-I18]
MKNTKILMVEDETDVLNVNCQYLQKLGYEVQGAQTLHDARLLVWNTPPDLILLDVMLPDGSGYDFCREVRKITAAPILFLTCLHDDENVIQGLSGGADDYIVKPYSLEVLGARVAAQLRRHGFGTGFIELPPLFIDLATGTASLGGEVLGLTRKEFQLLVFLVEHRGQEFSQAELFETVWGAPPEGMGNTVKVHISRLRRKMRLDDASAFELCTTERQGYLFLRVRYPAEG